MSSVGRWKSGEAEVGEISESGFSPGVTTSPRPCPPSSSSVGQPGASIGESFMLSPATVESRKDSSPRTKVSQMKFQDEADFICRVRLARNLSLQ